MFILFVTFLNFGLRIVRAVLITTPLDDHPLNWHDIYI